MAGTVKKSSNYRKMILGNVAALENHPIHGGIKMQAHHLISAHAVALSSVGPWLVKMDYNINLLPNLVLLPCTLQGSCHLGIQPHRGNHGMPSEKDDFDDDDEHPVSYHDAVSRRLKRLKQNMDKLCFANSSDADKNLAKKMNVLSNSILKMIQYTPSLMRLTAVADYYLPGLAGCGGMDNIPERINKNTLVLYKKESICAVSRNHCGAQGPEQKPENITYVKPINIYKLHAGR